MCDYCRKRKKLEDEYGELEAQITMLTPLPAIDLDTGMMDETADPPYFALFVGYDLDDKEDASFVIKYCPMCGERLAEETK